MTRTYRAGIVGLGFIGAGDQISGDAIGGQQVGNLDGTHSDALSRSDRIQLVAGSSRDAGRCQRFEERTGCPTYRDWAQMLNSERLDIVSVATYAPAHADITIACAESGILAVYCEKPIATSLPDAERMVHTCARTGTLLAINHNRRFNPNYRRLREMIANGELGGLTSVALSWGDGRLGNIGTHLIDAACMLTDRNICAASGTLDPSEIPDCRGLDFRDPGGFGWLRLDGGLMVSVDAADKAKGRAQIVINGTLGRATTGGTDITLEYWDGRHEHWPSPPREHTSMDRAVAEIVEALDGSAPFSYPPASAVQTLEAIIALHVSSIRNGAWVELPLLGDARELHLRTA